MFGMEPGFEPRSEQGRRFVQDLQARLWVHQPRRIRSVECQFQPIDEYGETVNVIINLEAEAGPVASFCKETLMSKEEVDYCFAIIVGYIRVTHPAILPTRFSLYFLDRHYSIENVKEQLRVIPEKAPEKYLGRWHSKEAVPDFFRRVWGGYLRSGLTMSLLKKRDEGLYHAIVNYRRDEAWPSDIEMPNREVALRAAVDAYKRGETFLLSADQLLAVAQFLKREQKKSASPVPVPARGRRQKSGQRIGSLSSG
jgi:hypothetical protein